jgi:fructan beta-fructosidase
MRPLLGLLALLFIAPIACIEPLIKADTDSLKTYSESFRPQFHFSPKAHWMNDPNGLVFQGGRYHLFYQYYPDSTVWGPMHWGHATSKDLLYWTHQPIALYPDSLGYIFSGSAVMDYQNTSGFGTEEHPAMVAVYTYHNMEGERSGRNDYQTQGIAYSVDQGQTWEKYIGNPVIDNPGIKDFRDPKVFWHESSQSWILVLVAGDHARFYRSDNLIVWTFLSSFGQDFGAHGGVWECPDLYPLSTDQGEQKWVLSVSINPGGPNGGSATQYFVGDFDGTQFTSDQKDIKWLDYGRDNYAGVTYSDAPDDQRILLGWMSNWDYAQVTPTMPWRSAMTLARRLDMKVENSDYYIVQHPVWDSTLIKHSSTLNIAEVNDGLILPVSKSHIEFEVDLGANTSLELYNSKERFVFSIEADNAQMTIDRRGSGAVDFSEQFAPGIQVKNYTPEYRIAKVEVFSDASSIEIFVDSGRHVFTNQVFPTQPYTHLKITTEGQTSDKIIFSELKSIWHEQ